MAHRVSIALAVLFIVAGTYSIGTPDGNGGWNEAGFEWNVAGFEWTSAGPQPVN